MVCILVYAMIYSFAQVCLHNCIKVIFCS
jgi:hypothetical protein